ncbi:MAG: DNA (cytosine-5-)-methyltransferase [Bacteroidales bacterium]|nr:DNA (cytosine-5-)-methyltransferase [Bacteroidales bacterium]
MRLATVFSGIGSIEQALRRLGKDYEIVFACDNGDVELNLLSGEDLEDYTRLTKLRSKKQLRAPKDIKRLEELSKKENSIAEAIRTKICSMPSKVEKKRFADRLYAENSRQRNFVKTAYMANYGDKLSDDDFHLDIRFLDGSDYRDSNIDLLVGGSPCQAFSDVGAKYGLNDTRGTLFYEFARIVNETQPRVFIYENVRGLTTHDDGKTWAVMRSVFENDLNYRIAEPQILNASDYGIPQSRRRVFVIGVRDDIKCPAFQYPAPIELQYTMQDFLEENCAYGHFNFDRQTGELIVERVPGQPDKKFTLTPAVQKYVLAGGTGNYSTSTETDLPIARTLMKMMTQHHRAGVDNYITVKKKPLVLRQLSDREALRLMGYPDDFKIEVSSLQTLRQAGNSIVVDVMMAIVRQIFVTKAIS